MEAKIKWVAEQQGKYEGILKEYIDFKQSIGMNLINREEKIANRIRFFESRIDEIISMVEENKV